ncbi:hypothetical protein WR25_17758 [Diploscapter pachys]|uniref:NADAR domain-containing protein n=1 Tax=Diploscapter pachys TaxID=2018661 RepID=A0A2A2LQA0_9BILA|nr:hypothetical protein WR25_17758 [Diploscapter pachys]
MSDPATLKKIEDKKKKAEQKKAAQPPLTAAAPQPLGPTGVAPGTTEIKPLSQTTQGHIPIPKPKPADFTKDTVGGNNYTSFEKGGNNGNEANNNNNKNNDSNGKKPFYPRRSRYNRPQQPAKAVPKQEVADLPLEVDTVDFKIDKEHVICFSGFQHWLSNMSPSPITIDEVTYPSVEHYYQACKVYLLGNNDLSSKISTVKNPQQTKSQARKLLNGVATKEKVEEWKMKDAPKILQYALKVKFTQNPELRKKLLETKDAILAHAFKNDSVFATGCGEADVKKWAEEKSGELVKIPVDFTEDPDKFKYVPLVGQGKNLLGFILMRIRAEIRQEDAAKTESGAESTKVAEKETKDSDKGKADEAAKKSDSTAAAAVKA